jgi:hypothetical protein
MVIEIEKLFQMDTTLTTNDYEYFFYFPLLLVCYAFIINIWLHEYVLYLNEDELYELAFMILLVLVTLGLSILVPLKDVLLHKLTPKNTVDVVMSILILVGVIVYSWVKVNEEEYYDDHDDYNGVYMDSEDEADDDME